MSTDRLRPWLAALALLAAAPAGAAEAPPAEARPEPVPVVAEAPFQQTAAAGSERSLDEAVFTEISPLSVPDIGVRLPEDQED